MSAPLPLPAAQHPPAPPTTTVRPSHLVWDVFCRVIDNHGDLGVSWRLSCQLARLGHHVRLWVDDDSALGWMAPTGHPGVEVLNWTQQNNAAWSQGLAPAQVWIEAFGCEIENSHIANYLIQTCQVGTFNINFPLWINLEYLSAEPYVERCHALPSPVMHGLAKGAVKRFFYPGFTPRTGGLLREPDLIKRQSQHDRQRWLRSQGVAWQGEFTVSLFCYEPPALWPLLRQWIHGDSPVLLLVTPGRAAQAFAKALPRLVGAPMGNQAPAAVPAQGRMGQLRWHMLPALPQPVYDELLWSCDLNMVRGEDSLVRAIWAGQALLWHIYPQDDGAHLTKLNAFLDWIAAPGDLRSAHATWNAETEGIWPPVDWQLSREAVGRARAALLEQPDLVTQLLAWAQPSQAEAGDGAEPSR